MKKSGYELKKKVLCSVLAAAVLGMSGSALAAEIINNPNYTENTDSTVDAIIVALANAKTLSFIGEGSVTIDNSKNNFRDVYAYFNGSILNFGTSDKQLQQLTIKGTTSNSSTFLAGMVYIGGGAKMNVYSQKFELNTPNTMGVCVKNNGSELNINVDEFTANTKYFALTASETGSIKINAEKVAITNASTNATDAAVESLLGGNLTINANDVAITNTSESGAVIWAQNDTESTTAPANASSISITADTISLKGATAGIVAFSNGQVSLVGDTTIEATNAIDVRGNSTVNINTDGEHTTVIKGDVVFETPATPENGHSSGSIINANVNLNLTGEGSSWTGTAYQEYKNSEADDAYQHSVELNKSPYQGNVTGFNVAIADGATWNMTGDSFVNNATVSGGGSIDVQEDVTTFNAGVVELDNATLNVEGEGQKLTINELTENDGTINLNGSDTTLKVGKLDGDGGTVNTNSLDNKVTVGEKSEDTTINVNGSSDITDQIASGEATLQDLADVVITTNGDEEQSAADTVTTEANDINGGFSASLDENGSIAAGSVKTYENATNRGVSDMASLALMTWRQENNDMNKRLGELRDSKGQHGAWARMARGESKYGSQNIKNQYNYYQVGYDEKLSVNPNWTVGVALTRTEGSSSFSTGSGDNKHTGVALYGSYLADNGSFIDLIAKYARMDHDYKTIGAAVGDADYETNGYSISAEYGKRFTKDSGLWLEPQVELTYGKVSSANYTTSKGANVRQEGMDSLVARLGFALGQNLKQGNVYVRASYLYDFDGETNVTMSKTGAGSYKYEQDIGGGWWEVGVGTNINLSDATHLYFDVEKTYGGSVATPWQWNAGIRYSF